MEPIVTLLARKSKGPSRGTSGFTLVEVLVVIVVLALLAAVVATRWSGVHHEAVVASAFGKLQFVDQHLRQFARSRQAPCLLAFDLEQGRLGKQHAAEGDHDLQWESLGTGMKIDAVRVGGEKPSSRHVEIPVDVRGQTPTYGLHVVGPGKRETWLLFAGLSGQMTEFENARSWNAAFELMAPPSL